MNRHDQHLSKHWLQREFCHLQEQQLAIASMSSTLKKFIVEVNSYQVLNHFARSRELQKHFELILCSLARLRLVKGETQMRFARKPEIRNITLNPSSSAAQMFQIK